MRRKKTVKAPFNWHRFHKHLSSKDATIWVKHADNYILLWTKLHPEQHNTTQHWTRYLHCNWDLLCTNMPNLQVSIKRIITVLMKKDSLLMERRRSAATAETILTTAGFTVHPGSQAHWSSFTGTTCTQSVPRPRTSACPSCHSSTSTHAQTHTHVCARPQGLSKRFSSFTVTDTMRLLSVLLAQERREGAQRRCTATAHSPHYDSATVKVLVENKPQKHKWTH